MLLPQIDKLRDKSPVIIPQPRRGLLVAQPIKRPEAIVRNADTRFIMILLSFRTYIPRHKTGGESVRVLTEVTADQTNTLKILSRGPIKSS